MIGIPCCSIGVGAIDVAPVRPINAVPPFHTRHSLGRADLFRDVAVKDEGPAEVLGFSYISCRVNKRFELRVGNCGHAAGKTTQALAAHRSFPVIGDLRRCGSINAACSWNFNSIKVINCSGGDDLGAWRVLRWCIA